MRFNLVSRWSRWSRWSISLSTTKRPQSAAGGACAARDACNGKRDYALLDVSSMFMFRPLAIESSGPLSGGATKNYALELYRKPLAVFVGHKLPESPKKALGTHSLFLCPPAKPGLVRLTMGPRLPHPAGHALNGLMHQNKYHHKLPLPPDESLPFRRVRKPPTTTPQRSKFNRRPIVNLHILLHACKKS